jgi:hypothetical protein
MARKYLDLAKKNPGPYAYRLEGVMKVRLRLHREALSELERGLVLAPNNAALHEEMAWVLTCAGRPKEAIDHAKFALRFDPRRTYKALWLLGVAYFSMGDLEQAATYFERSLRHNPEYKAVLFILGPTYALLGWEKKAQDALANFHATEHWWWWWDLPMMMFYFPFKDPEVTDRFAKGLLKEGFTGEPFGYYKILEEHKVGGEEIRELVFDRETKIEGRGFFDWVYRTKDGIIMDGDQAVGKSRIDGEMLCDRWDSRFEGLEYCGTVFCNPEGTSDTEDEYLYVTDFGVCTLSPVE